jgi:purine catabolism regulator
MRLRPLDERALAPVAGRRLTVRDVLAFPAFSGSRVEAGARGLDRPVARVNVMQVPTAAFAQPDELILAATSAFDDPQLPPPALVEALADRGVAALAAHGPTLAKLGADGERVASERALPLLALPPRARLNGLLTSLLETLVAAQARHLRMAATTRDELVELVASGGGLDELAATLARLIAGAVAIVDADGLPLARAGSPAGLDDRAAAEAGRPEAPRVAGPRRPRANAGAADGTAAAAAWLNAGWEVPAGAGDGWVVWPVTATGTRLGCLAARPGRAGDPLLLSAIESGARTAAFAILHALDEAAALSSVRGAFVRDLLSGTLDEAGARQRAAAVGWDPDTPYRVLLARPERPAAEACRRLAELAPAALTFQDDGEAFALLAATPDPLAIAAQLAQELPAGRIGLSRPHTAIGALAAAHIEAAEAVRCAEVFPAGNRLRTFDPRSPLRLLSRVDPAELRAFEREILRPLDAVAGEQRRVLEATLDLLLDTQLNVAETARRGGWHYNTVRYRVTRLSELLGPFFEDGSRLDAIALALLLRRELAP